jgi:nucleoside-diphosphate-sugar epimerase
MNLIVGCGYLGSRVARLWHKLGEEVTVVTRSADRTRELILAGYTPLVGDVTDARSLDELRQLGPIASVLYAVGFDPASQQSRREVYVNGLRNTLEALPTDTDCFLYISTTGIYAQNDGSWVDEDSPCLPETESGQLFLEAENLLREHALANRAIVLRLAGLYGPGRIPRREELAAGSSISAAPEAYLNLIHVDDAAGIVCAVAEHAQPPRTYIASDGHPVERREYYSEAARLLGAPSPVFAEQDSTRAATTRGGSNKRVSNARLTSEIPYNFLHPTYKHGLVAIVERS